MSETDKDSGARKIRLPVSIKVLVCSSSEEVASVIRALPETVPGVTVEVISSDASALTDDMVTRSKADVLIADVRLDNPNDLERLNHFSQQSDPALYVMATARESSVEGVRRLMRLGISDFLPQPVNVDELVVGLQNAARKVRQRSPIPTSQIIPCFHASGGAGATTLAVNTAVALKRINRDSNVCILDLDLQFGQVALNLDLSNAHGILDVIEETERLDPTFLSGIMVHHKTGVDVLAAPDALVALDVLTPDLVAKLLDVATELYDFIIVDMPIALTAWSQTALRRATATVLVGQLTVPGVRQLRRLVSILAADGVRDLHLFVVLNRYLGHWKTAIRPKEAEEALGRHVDFLVANDYKTASMAVDRGIPIHDVSRHSRIAKDISKLANAIMSKIQVLE